MEEDVLMMEDDVKVVEEEDDDGWGIPVRRGSALVDMFVRRVWCVSM